MVTHLYLLSGLMALVCHSVRDYHLVRPGPFHQPVRAHLEVQLAHQILAAQSVLVARRGRMVLDFRVRPENDAKRIGHETKKY